MSCLTILIVSLAQSEFCRNFNVGRPGHGLDQLSIKSHPNVEMDISAKTGGLQTPAEFNNLDPQLVIGSAQVFSAPVVESREPQAAEWSVIAGEVQQLLIRWNVDPRLVRRIISGMMELNPTPQT